jgi:hypothetical protein
MADDDIITGTSEVIGILVLRWAGLEDMWDQHELGWDYNPTRDVVEWCNGDGLDVDRNDWEADRPMYSMLKAHAKAFVARAKAQSGKKPQRTPESWAGTGVRKPSGQKALVGTASFASSLRVQSGRITGIPGAGPE